jgi:uncharacterized protein (DUF427 family)
MPKAIWNGTVLAESDRTVIVEGNHYFPADAINKEYFQDSSTHTTCPWKGVASYYSIEEMGKSIKMLLGTIPAPRKKLRI